MATKKWSYKEITERTETLIKQSMSLAIKAESDFERWQHRNVAWGAYFNWSGITTGWQNVGDDERMENLTKIGNYQ